MKEQRFRRMEVWKKAMDFIEEIYKTTQKFPSEELYGLMRQLRRAATSIALNIAEGSAAESDREFNRFLTISLGSIYEVMCGIEIAVRLSFCNKEEAVNLFRHSDELAAMITSFKKKLIAES